jgi:hypothetical protein
MRDGLVFGSYTSISIDISIVLDLTDIHLIQGFCSEIIWLKMQVWN